jgi:hypothetical protein
MFQVRRLISNPSAFLFVGILAALSLPADAESVQDYVAEFRKVAVETTTSGTAPALPSTPNQLRSVVLDSDRIIRMGDGLLRSASDREFAEIGNALLALVPSYMTPINAPALKRPLDYVAFWEVITVFQEILGYRGALARAKLDDIDLKEMGYKSLCRWPGMQDSQISILRADIDSKRFAGDALAKAIATVDRLELRRNWYASDQHQRQCRNIDAFTLAPLIIPAIDAKALDAYKKQKAEDNAAEAERSTKLQPLIDTAKTISKQIDDRSK